jgi:TolB-like protein
VYVASRGTPGRAIPIAIARFTNDSGDGTLDKTASLLTDSLIGELAASTDKPGYAVVGNAAQLRQPVGLRDVLKIGLALEVKFVMLGALQPRNGKVDVFVQVIRIPDQRHVWVAREPASAEELKAGYLTLARRLARAMSGKLSS